MGSVDERLNKGIQNSREVAVKMEGEGDSAST